MSVLFAVYYLQKMSLNEAHSALQSLKKYKKRIKREIMQKIVLFIEPPTIGSAPYEFETPVKIANLFMNRFAIEEDASFEILKIFELADRGTKHKGMDHFIVIRDF